MKVRLGLSLDRENIRAISDTLLFCYDIIILFTYKKKDDR